MAAIGSVVDSAAGCRAAALDRQLMIADVDVAGDGRGRSWRWPELKRLEVGFAGERWPEVGLAVARVRGLIWL